MPASAGTRDGVKGRRTCLAARAPLHAQVGLLLVHATVGLGSTRTLILGTPTLFIRKRAVRLQRGRRGERAPRKSTLQKRLWETEGPESLCCSPTQRQASAGARDGVKGTGRTLAARAACDSSAPTRIRAVSLNVRRGGHIPSANRRRTSPKVAQEVAPHRAESRRSPASKAAPREALAG